MAFFIPRSGIWIIKFAYFIYFSQFYDDKTTDTLQ